MTAFRDVADDIAAISKIEAVSQILEVICRTTGLGFSAVARVTDSQWVACAVRDEIAFGLQAGGELRLETTLCKEIHQHDGLVVIEEVSADPVYCSHPTPARYGFQSYISVPIHRKSGEFFGTLCAIDPKPARLNTPATVGMFQLFADLIALHLENQERLEAAEAALSREQAAARAREQFIAVLGHDLRNPLNAINMGTQILRKQPLNPESLFTLEMMERGAQRMGGLVDNVLDLARSRYAGGLKLRLRETADLAEVLDQVADELQATKPNRTIRREFNVPGPVCCDPERLAQMLSNLLANALTHGCPEQDVVVTAKGTAESLKISVTNGGNDIPEETLARLFLPFTRGSASADETGLGLGLYIAAEIARAHGGELKVRSQGGETCFTFTLNHRREAQGVQSSSIVHAV